MGETADCWLVEVGAGEKWHDTVERLLAMDRPGLENLALIPGLAGAAPIQNIGAYGIELAERFHGLRAWDAALSDMVTMSPVDCGFGYRDSVFKHQPLANESSSRSRLRCPSAGKRSPAMRTSPTS